MGILSKKEMENINKKLMDNNSCIVFSPVMQKDFDTILLDRMENIVYFVTRMNFDKCYKKQTLAAFKKSVDKLKEEGWMSV